MASPSTTRGRRPAARSPILGLRLQNLRAFEDTGQLSLGRINFIFGKNSSGKTTILRSPLLLKQLAQTTSLTGEIPFAGPYVDFGSYAESVHNGLRSKDITLSFDCDSRRVLQPTTNRRLRDPFLELQNIRVEMQLHWNATRGHSQMAKLAFSTIDGSPLMQYKRKGPDKFGIEATFAGVAFDVSGVGELSLQSLAYLDLDYDSPEDELARVEFGGFRLFDVLRSATARISHIGPLRDTPDRAYRSEQLVAPGAPTPSALGIMSANPQALVAAKAALLELGIARDVSITRPAPGYAGITVTDINTGRKDNLVDVGFGVSQVLPIIVQVATAPANSLIIIEQPELHLHPETQAALVDVLIRLAAERRATLLIESHSENMLLRLRRHVASGRLQKDEVKVYVTDKGNVRPAPIDESGNIDMAAFPDDFFEEEWLEAVELAKAAGQRARGAK